MTSMGKRIVVGVGDSADSLTAAEVAAAEAALRHRPLHVVHADPFAKPADWTVAGPLPDDEAGRLLVRAVERARAAAGGVVVTGEVARGFPPPVLIAASRDAELVVIGDRGLGVLGRAWYETVVDDLVLGVMCPVLVVRGVGDPYGPIVVGVDGSAAAESAVGFAFAEADLRRRPLIVVHAWSRPGPHAPGSASPVDLDSASVRAGAERLVSEASVGWTEKFPDVEVQHLLVHGHPRRVLTDGGDGASLLVVGTRGRTVRPVLGLGSVSRHLLHYAPCPVAVVPSASLKDGEADGTL